MNKKVIIGIIAAAFCNYLYGAPTNKEIPVVLDGEIIKAKNIGNESYLKINDLKRLLNWNVKIDSGAISITTVKAETTSVPSEIKGVFTYYFNSNYGSKPDAGSRIYLLDGNSVFSPSQDDFFWVTEDTIDLVSKYDDKKTQYKILSKATSDGNGSFSIKGVRPGKYLAIMVSSHSKGRDLLTLKGKIFTQSVEISNGEIIDISHDFGMSDR